MKRQWALTTTSIDELNTPSFVVHAPTLTFKADTTKIHQSKSNQDLVLDHAIPENDGNDHSNEIITNKKLEKTKKKNGKKEETMNLSKSTPNLLHATKYQKSPQSSPLKQHLSSPKCMSLTNNKGKDVFNTRRIARSK